MTISGRSADWRALLLALGNKFLSLMSLHKQMFSWTDAVCCHSLSLFCMQGMFWCWLLCAGKTLVTTALMATLTTQCLVTQHWQLSVTASSVQRLLWWWHGREIEDTGPGGPALHQCCDCDKNRSMLWEGLGSARCACLGRGSAQLHTHGTQEFRKGDSYFYSLEHNII